MTATVGAAEVRAKVGQLRRKARVFDVVGIHTEGTWTGPDSIEVDDVDYDVVSCPSALAVRERLAAPRPPGRGLVFLTDREDRDLGLDVLARIAKERLQRLERWTTVLEMFGARELDPWLVGKSWLADALIESSPVDGYARVPTVLLDQETAWDALLSVRLGLRARPPSLSGLLDWTRNAHHREAWERLSDEVRAGAVEWWSERAGPAVQVLEHALRVGRGADAIPFGLACGVLFDETGRSELVLQKAVAKLETTLELDELTVDVGRRYAAAAETVVRQLRAVASSADVHALLERGDAVLAELKASEEAHRSHVLPAGFEQRRSRHAAALLQVVDGGLEPAGLDALEKAVTLHESAAAHAKAVERVQMTSRLARWLRRKAPASPGSFAEAALAYASCGAWVDRARESVRRGNDSREDVREAHRRVLEAVGAQREEQNRRFAELLVDWSTTPEVQDDAVVPIERVLDTVVAPIARQARVLLLVVDGMSLAVFTDLLGDLEGQGFVERSADPSGRRAVAISALPSVTEVSRTSLLSGVIRRGTQDTERKSFTEHAALRAAAGATGAPLLFHKGDLKNHDTGGLADEVRKEIADKKRRVVGVVLNAIDDHLMKGDQSRVAWSVDHIIPLLELLTAARDGERVIVVTSDHGHVLEHGLESRSHEDAQERCRPYRGTVDEGEVVVRGPRVVAGSADVVVLPWSERLRYCHPKNGYHGGATPQEVVVPVAVFAASRVEIAGWRDAAVSPPDWWTEELAAVAPRAEPTPAKPPRKAPPKGLLFDTRPRPAASEEGLVARLVHSRVYLEQKQLAARTALPDDRVVALLETLERHGGKMTRVAFAKAVDLTPIRVNGVLATLRRVLNVDGYPILSVSEEGETVSLDLGMMETQFDL